jgi:hypothetical protein
MRFYYFLSACALCSLSYAVKAQSPVSGFMNGKGKGTVAFSYTAEQYDNVFLTPSDAKGVPVFNEVDIKSTSLYTSYGISDRFDMVLSLPYIKAEGQASEVVLRELGYENTRSGIQDLSVFAKYNPLTLDFDGNKLQFVLGAGVSTPLGSYKVDEGLQSIIAIGNRSTRLTGLGIAHFQTAGGFFLSTQAGYSLRSDEVPNALLGEIKAGIALSKFYADVWYAGQVSDGGTDILADGFTGFFPATNVSFNRAGVNIYVPIGGGFGISAGASKYLNGRNIGESTGFSGSLVFSF